MKWLLPSVMIICLLLPMGLTSCDQPTFHEDEVIAIAQQDVYPHQIGSGYHWGGVNVLPDLYQWYSIDKWTAHYEGRGKWQITADITLQGLTETGRYFKVYQDTQPATAICNYYENTGMLIFRELRLLR